MMTKEQRIEWLLDLQGNPEQLTDEQLQQILADDEMRQLVQQLGFAKRAFKHQELKDNPLDVDNEWEKFAATHAEELDALDEERSKPHSSLFNLHFSIHKVAASFVGVLLASGITFATIHIVRQHQKAEALQVADTTEVAKSSPITHHSSHKEDTIPSEPCVFNNVPLDSMLTVIAAAHQVGVEFENDTARGLRFYFVWKPEDSLARIAEKLNTFDAVNIVVEDKKLIVR